MKRRKTIQWCKENESGKLTEKRRNGIDFRTVGNREWSRSVMLKVEMILNMKFEEDAWWETKTSCNTSLGSWELKRKTQLTQLIEMPLRKKLSED